MIEFIIGSVLCAWTFSMGHTQFKKLTKTLDERTEAYTELMKARVEILALRETQARNQNHILTLLEKIIRMEKNTPQPPDEQPPQISILPDAAPQDASTVPEAIMKFAKGLANAAIQSTSEEFPGLSEITLTQISRNVWITAITLCMNMPAARTLLQDEAGVLEAWDLVQKQNPEPFKGIFELADKMGDIES